MSEQDRPTSGEGASGNSSSADASSNGPRLSFKLKLGGPKPPSIPEVVEAAPKAEGVSAANVIAPSADTSTPSVSTPAPPTLKPKFSFKLNAPSGPATPTTSGSSTPNSASNLTPSLHTSDSFSRSISRVDSLGTRGSPLVSSGHISQTPRFNAPSAQAKEANARVDHLNMLLNKALVPPRHPTGQLKYRDIDDFTEEDVYRSDERGFYESKLVSSLMTALTEEEADEFSIPNKYNVDKVDFDHRTVPIRILDNYYVCDYQGVPIPLHLLWRPSDLRTEAHGIQAFGTVITDLGRPNGIKGRQNYPLRWRREALEGKLDPVESNAKDFGKKSKKRTKITLGQRLTRESCFRQASELYSRSTFPMEVSSSLIIESLGNTSSAPDYHNQNFVFPIGFRSIRTHMNYLKIGRRGEYLCEILEGESVGPSFRVTPLFDPSASVTGHTATDCWKVIFERIEKSKKDFLARSTRIEDESMNSSSTSSHFTPTKQTVAGEALGVAFPSSILPSPPHTSKGGPYLDSNFATTAGTNASGTAGEPSGHILFGYGLESVAKIVEGLPGTLDCPNYVFFDLRAKNSVDTSSVPVSRLRRSGASLNAGRLHIGSGRARVSSAADASEGTSGKNKETSAVSGFKRGREDFSDEEEEEEAQEQDKRLQYLQIRRHLWDLIQSFQVDSSNTDAELDMDHIKASLVDLLGDSDPNSSASSFVEENSAEIVEMVVDILDMIEANSEAGIPLYTKDIDDDVGDDGEYEDDEDTEGEADSAKNVTKSSTNAASSLSTSVATPVPSSSDSSSATPSQQRLRVHLNNVISVVSLKSFSFLRKSKVPPLAILTRHAFYVIADFRTSISPSIPYRLAARPMLAVYESAVLTLRYINESQRILLDFTLSGSSDLKNVLEEPVTPSSTDFRPVNLTDAGKYLEVSSDRAVRGELSSDDVRGSGILLNGSDIHPSAPVIFDLYCILKQLYSDNIVNTDSRKDSSMTSSNEDSSSMVAEQKPQAVSRKEYLDSFFSTINTLYWAWRESIPVASRLQALLFAAEKRFMVYTQYNNPTSSIGSIFSITNGSGVSQGSSSNSGAGSLLSQFQGTMCGSQHLLDFAKACLHVHLEDGIFLLAGPAGLAELLKVNPLTLQDHPELFRKIGYTLENLKRNGGISLDLQGLVQLACTHNSGLAGKEAILTTDGLRRSFDAAATQLLNGLQITNMDSYSALPSLTGGQRLGLDDFSGGSEREGPIVSGFSYNLHISHTLSNVNQVAFSKQAKLSLPQQIQQTLRQPPPLLPLADIPGPPGSMEKLLAVWQFCQSFSDILRLRPFRFDDLVAAVVHEGPSTLVSAVAMSLLQLVHDEKNGLSTTSPPVLSPSQVPVGYVSVNSDGSVTVNQGAVPLPGLAPHASDDDMSTPSVTGKRSTRASVVQETQNVSNSSQTAGENDTTAHSAVVPLGQSSVVVGGISNGMGADNVAPPRAYNWQSILAVRLQESLTSMEKTELRVRRFNRQLQQYVASGKSEGGAVSPPAPVPSRELLGQKMLKCQELLESMLVEFSGTARDLDSMEYIYAQNPDLFEPGAGPGAGISGSTEEEPQFRPLNYNMYGAPSNGTRRFLVTLGMIRRRVASGYYNTVFDEHSLFLPRGPRPAPTVYVDDGWSCDDSYQSMIQRMSAALKNPSKSGAVGNQLHSKSRMQVGCAANSGPKGFASDIRLLLTNAGKAFASDRKKSSEILHIRKYFEDKWQELLQHFTDLFGEQRVEWALSRRREAPAIGSLRDPSYLDVLDIIEILDGSHFWEIPVNYRAAALSWLTNEAACTRPVQAAVVRAEEDALKSEKKLVECRELRIRTTVGLHTAAYKCGIMALLAASGSLLGRVGANAALESPILSLSRAKVYFSQLPQLQEVIFSGFPNSSLSTNSAGLAAYLDAVPTPSTLGTLLSHVQQQKDIIQSLRSGIHFSTTQSTEALLNYMRVSVAQGRALYLGSDRRHRRYMLLNESLSSADDPKTSLRLLVEDASDPSSVRKGRPDVESYADSLDPLAPPDIRRLTRPSGDVAFDPSYPAGRIFSVEPTALLGWLSSMGLREADLRINVAVAWRYVLAPKCAYALSEYRSYVARVRHFLQKFENSSNRGIEFPKEFMVDPSADYDVAAAVLGPFYAANGVRFFKATPLATRGNNSVVTQGGILFPASLLDQQAQLGSLGTAVPLDYTPRKSVTRALLCLLNRLVPKSCPHDKDLLPLIQPLPSARSRLPLGDSRTLISLGDLGSTGLYYKLNILPYLQGNSTEKGLLRFLRWRPTFAPNDADIKAYIASLSTALKPARPLPPLPRPRTPDTLPVCSHCGAHSSPVWRQARMGPGPAGGAPRVVETLGALGTYSAMPLYACLLQGLFPRANNCVSGELRDTLLSGRRLPSEYFSDCAVTLPPLVQRLPQPAPHTVLLCIDCTVFSRRSKGTLKNLGDGDRDSVETLRHCLGLPLREAGAGATVGRSDDLYGGAVWETAAAAPLDPQWGNHAAPLDLGIVQETLLERTLQLGLHKLGVDLMGLNPPLLNLFRKSHELDSKMETEEEKAEFGLQALEKYDLSYEDNFLQNIYALLPSFARYLALPSSPTAQNSFQTLSHSISSSVPSSSYPSYLSHINASLETLHDEVNPTPLYSLQHAMLSLEARLADASIAPVWRYSRVRHAWRAKVALPAAVSPSSLFQLVPDSCSESAEALETGFIDVLLSTIPQSVDKFDEISNTPARSLLSLQVRLAAAASAQRALAAAVEAEALQVIREALLELEASIYQEVRTLRNPLFLPFLSERWSSARSGWAERVRVATTVFDTGLLFDSFASHFNFDAVSPDNMHLPESSIDRDGFLNIPPESGRVAHGAAPVGSPSAVGSTQVIGSIARDAVTKFGSMTGTGSAVISYIPSIGDPVVYFSEGLAEAVSLAREKAHSRRGKSLSKMTKSLSVVSSWDPVVPPADSRTATDILAMFTPVPGTGVGVVSDIRYFSGHKDPFCLVQLDVQRWIERDPVSLPSLESFDITAPLVRALDQAASKLDTASNGSDADVNSTKSSRTLSVIQQRLGNVAQDVGEHLKSTAETDSLSDQAILWGLRVIDSPTHSPFDSQALPLPLPSPLCSVCNMPACAGRGVSTSFYEQYAATSNGVQLINDRYNYVAEVADAESDTDVEGVPGRYPMARLIASLERPSPYPPQLSDSTDRDWASSALIQCAVDGCSRSFHAHCVGAVNPSGSVGSVAGAQRDPMLICPAHHCGVCLRAIATPILADPAGVPLGAACVHCPSVYCVSCLACLSVSSDTQLKVPGQHTPENIISGKGGALWSHTDPVTSATPIQPLDTAARLSETSSSLNISNQFGIGNSWECAHCRLPEVRQHSLFVRAASSIFTHACDGLSHGDVSLTNQLIDVDLEVLLHHDLVDIVPSTSSPAAPAVTATGSNLALAATKRKDDVRSAGSKVVTVKSVSFKKDPASVAALAKFHELRAEYCRMKLQQAPAEKLATLVQRARSGMYPLVVDFVRDVISALNKSASLLEPQLSHAKAAIRCGLRQLAHPLALRALAEATLDMVSNGALRDALGGEVKSNEEQSGSTRVYYNVAMLDASQYLTRRVRRVMVHNRVHKKDVVNGMTDSVISDDSRFDLSDLAHWDDSTWTKDENLPLMDFLSAIILLANRARGEAVQEAEIKERELAVEVLRSWGVTINHVSNADNKKKSKEKPEVQLSVDPAHTNEFESLMKEAAVMVLRHSHLSDNNEIANYGTVQVYPMTFESALQTLLAQRNSRFDAELAEFRKNGFSSIAPHIVFDEATELYGAPQGLFIDIQREYGSIGESYSSDIIPDSFDIRDLNFQGFRDFLTVNNLFVDASVESNASKHSSSDSSSRWSEYLNQVSVSREESTNVTSESSLRSEVDRLLTPESSYLSTGARVLQRIIVPIRLRPSQSDYLVPLDRYLSSISKPISIGEDFYSFRVSPPSTLEVTSGTMFAEHYLVFQRAMRTKDAGMSKSEHMKTVQDRVALTSRRIRAERPAVEFGKVYMGRVAGLLPSRDASFGILAPTSEFGIPSATNLEKLDLVTSARSITEALLSHEQAVGPEALAAASALAQSLKDNTFIGSFDSHALFNLVQHLTASIKKQYVSNVTNSTSLESLPILKELHQLVSSFGVSLSTLYIPPALLHTTLAAGRRMLPNHSGQLSPLPSPLSYSSTTGTMAQSYRALQTHAYLGVKGIPWRPIVLEWLDFRSIKGQLTPDIRLDSKSHFFTGKADRVNPWDSIELQHTPMFSATFAALANFGSNAHSHFATAAFDDIFTNRKLALPLSLPPSLSPQQKATLWKSKSRQDEIANAFTSVISSTPLSLFSGTSFSLDDLHKLRYLFLSFNPQIMHKIAAERRAVPPLLLHNVADSDSSMKNSNSKSDGSNTLDLSGYLLYNGRKERSLAFEGGMKPIRNDGGRTISLSLTTSSEFSDSRFPKSRKLKFERDWNSVPRPGGNLAAAASSASVKCSMCGGIKPCLCSEISIPSTVSSIPSVPSHVTGIPHGVSASSGSSSSSLVSTHSREKPSIPVVAMNTAHSMTAPIPTGPTPPGKLAKPPVVAVPQRSTALPSVGLPARTPVHVSSATSVPFSGGGGSGGTDVLTLLRQAAESVEGTRATLMIVKEQNITISHPMLQMVQITPDKATNLLTDDKAVINLHNFVKKVFSTWLINSPRPQAPFINKGNIRK